MELKLRSAIPIFLVGLTFALYGIFFPLYMPIHLLVATSLSMIVFFISDRLIAPKTIYVEAKLKTPVTGVKEADVLLAQGTQLIKELRVLDDLIEDEDISRLIVQLQTQAKDILDAVAQKPGKARQIRKFINHYLPMAIQILTHFTEMPGGAEHCRFAKTKQRIEETLQMLVEAFQRQHESLFEAEALDMSTDITVLEALLAREGLATNEANQQ